MATSDERCCEIVKLFGQFEGDLTKQLYLIMSAATNFAEDDGIIICCCTLLKALFTVHGKQLVTDTIRRDLTSYQPYYNVMLTQMRHAKFNPQEVMSR